MGSNARTIGINAALGVVPIAGYVLLIVLESAHIIAPLPGSWIAIPAVVVVLGLIWVNRHLFATYPVLVRAIFVVGISVGLVAALFVAGVAAIAVTVGVPP